MHELHNIDDGSLTNKISETKTTITTQDTDLEDMKKRIDDLQQMVDAIVSSTHATLIEIDSQEDRLEHASSQKKSLL